MTGAPGRDGKDGLPGIPGLPVSSSSNLHIEESAHILRECSLWFDLIVNMGHGLSCAFLVMLFIWRFCTGVCIPYYFCFLEIKPNEKTVFQVIC